MHAKKRMHTQRQSFKAYFLVVYSGNLSVSMHYMQRRNSFFDKYIYIKICILSSRSYVCKQKLCIKFILNLDNSIFVILSNMYITFYKNKKSAS